MRILVVAAVLLATAACGAYQFPGGASPSPSTGNVSGTIRAYPCAPVERIDSPCAGRPVAGLELDYLQGTTPAAKAVSDANGHYSIDLPAGSYTVKLKSYMRVMTGPSKISVAAGSSIVADYTVDSGIRVPVPQQ